MDKAFPNPISPTFYTPFRGFRAASGGAPVVPPALLTGLVDVWEMNEVSPPPSSEKNSWPLVPRIGAGTFVAGLIGNAYSIPSSGYSAERINTWGVNGGAMSFSVWFKDVASISDGNERGMICGVNISSNVRSSIYTQNGNVFMNRDGIGGGISGGNVFIGTMGDVLSAAAFWHYVMTFDGTTVTAYLNGSVIGTPATPTGTANGFAGAVTGFSINYKQGWTGYDFSNTKSMAGIYDQTGIWNKALSPSEVTALYNGGAGLAYSSWTA